MINKEQVKNIKSLIEKHEHIIIFHHINPDGDCIASSFGLAEVLMNMYPDKDIRVCANIKDFIPHLLYINKYLNWDKTTTIPKYDDYLGIIGDVSTKNRVRFFDNFKDKINSLIVFDHHENELSIDNVNEFWSEPSYSASALMVYELIIKMKMKISENAALIINHGILTDTGWYKFCPGDELTLNISGKLNKIIGIEKQKKFYYEMNSKTLNDIKFQSWVLKNFKTVNKKIAYLTINEKDLKKFEFLPSQAARVNLLSEIENIEVWLFFIQYDENVRVEFRSRSIWVDEIAAEFGGGGHHYAAGTRIQNMLQHEKIIKRLIEELEKI